MVCAMFPVLCHLYFRILPFELEFITPIKRVHMNIQVVHDHKKIAGESGIAVFKDDNTRRIKPLFNFLVGIYRTSAFKLVDEI